MGNQEQGKPNTIRVELKFEQLNNPRRGQLSMLTNILLYGTQGPANRNCKNQQSTAEKSFNSHVYDRGYYLHATQTKLCVFE